MVRTVGGHRFRRMVIGTTRRNVNRTGCGSFLLFELDGDGFALAGAILGRCRETNGGSLNLFFEVVATVELVVSDIGRRWFNRSRRRRRS